jgi:hypothetical protein
VSRTVKPYFPGQTTKNKFVLGGSEGLTYNPLWIIFIGIEGLWIGNSRITPQQEVHRDFVCGPNAGSGGNASAMIPRFFEKKLHTHGDTTMQRIKLTPKQHAILNETSQPDGHYLRAKDWRSIKGLRNMDLIELVDGYSYNWRITDKGRAVLNVIETGEVTMFQT